MKLIDGKKLEGLDLLRDPFPDHQIGRLPKPTKEQTDAVKSDFKVGVRCEICGGWHHPKVIHLDYVGHAALTDRLLDCDPQWSWEPCSMSDDGLPLFDQSGGLWIKLTVCGVTRLGYGNAEPSNYKDIGSREKEIIGDALRNAAMRFGAALDLWHKGELHSKPAHDSVKIKSEIEAIASSDELTEYWHRMTKLMRDEFKVLVGQHGASIKAQERLAEITESLVAAEEVALISGVNVADAVKEVWAELTTVEQANVWNSLDQRIQEVMNPSAAGETE